MLRLFFLVGISFLAFACNSGLGDGHFVNPKALTVDSVNDRLFVIESNQEILVRTASNNSSIGDQPVIDENRDEDSAILNLVPELVTDAVSYPQGDDTLLFLLGAQVSDEGATTLNQLTVLEFDGENFSESAISPVTIDDGDEATDESDDTFASMVVDVDRAQIFVSDFTTAQIFVLDAVTGNNLVPPLTVASEPLDMVLDGENLYVCHADEALTDSISVINVIDYTAETIVLDSPCQGLAVISNDSGTVLAVKRGNENVIDLYLLNSDDLSLTPIPTTESGFTGGQLLSGAGFTSTVSSMLLTKDASGVIYGYFAEQDGNLQIVTIASDLSGFTHQTFSTSALNYLKGDVLLDDDGETLRIWFIAEAGFLLSIENQDGDIDADLDS